MKICKESKLKIKRRRKKKRLLEFLFAKRSLKMESLFQKKKGTWREADEKKKELQRRKKNRMSRSCRCCPTFERI